MSRRTLLRGGGLVGAGAVVGGAATALMMEGRNVTDLSTLFNQPAAGPSQAMKYRQGQIMAFNPLTLENIVNVGNAIMTNLPVLGVSEATLLVPGSIVGILVVGDDDGAKGMTILGRSVIPNTADAINAITILGQNVSTDFVAAQETTTSVPFADLATVGPTVSINVRASGKVLLFLAATIANSNGGGPAAGALWGAFMNVQLTGANIVAPSSIPGGLGYSSNGVTGGGPFSEYSIARMIPFSGLTPGVTQFQAKYAIGVGLAGETARFRNRSLAVFAL